MVAGEANVNLANLTLIRSNRKTLALAKTGAGAGAESCELDANSLKSGRAGQGTGQGNSCELDANSRKSANEAGLGSASNSRKSPNDRPGFEPTAFGHERTKTLARSIWPAGRCVIGSRLQATAKNLALHPSLRI